MLNFRLFTVDGAEMLNSSAVNLTESIGSVLVNLPSVNIRSASMSKEPVFSAFAEKVSLPLDAEKGIFSAETASASTVPASVLKVSGRTVTPSGIVSAKVNSLSLL